MYQIRIFEMCNAVHTYNNEPTCTLLETVRDDPDVVAALDSNYPEFDCIDVELIEIDQDGDLIDLVDSWEFDDWETASAFIAALQEKHNCDVE